MKNFFFLITVLFSGLAFSQEVTNLKEIKPHEEFENTLIKKLDTDDNSTSFIIWIKKGVKSHKHETHSEIISVIEGEGVMTINKKSFDIKSGDYFRIPKNTFHSLEVKSKKAMKVLSVQSPEFLGKDRFFEN
jgi:mannose-6-phosphate isomerase-like protein (cupin superfamily)